MAFDFDELLRVSKKPFEYKLTEETLEMIVPKEQPKTVSLISDELKKHSERIRQQINDSLQGIYITAKEQAVIPTLSYSEEDENAITVGEFTKQQLENWEELQKQKWKLEKESHFTVNEAHYIEGYIFTGESEEYDIFFKALVAKDFNEIVIIENDFEDLLWRVSGTEFVKQKKNADKLLMETIKKNRVRIITGAK
jgi:hypothetical protein